MSEKKIKLYFDCDTGIDDAMALGYLLAESDKVDILAIGTVCGNVAADAGARNTLELARLAGFPAIPVAVGERDYLRQAYLCDVQHIHGDNGIGDIALEASHAKLAPLPAPELLVELARAHPGELDILATGPLTNIAKALQLEPALGELIGTLTIMGGAALAPGNRTPVAEANIACDPEAAAMVFKAMKNIVMVPLDVTMSHTFEEADRLKLLSAESRFAQAIGQMLERYIQFYINTYGRKACALHDPVAAVLAVQGIGACFAPNVKVTIDDSDGPGRGQTLCDMRGRYMNYPPQPDANCHVVLSTELNMSELLLAKLLSLPAEPHKQ
ncbi:MULTISPECIES: nucleoside hydrolase [Serratia]|uniref:nucleoside hydrolase n=1 Tax=Serratia TaxID=613 RepID=UPI000744E82F|nr:MULTISPECIES: nucleoside hydrolase [Serratia]APS35204.1 nucleoside hydrolase [Serratia marcescens]CUY21102.1 Pyrimidine-specific ribonucleoside hydrolase rihA [Serratia marcescens]CUY58409.1 Pyrimidine-specific ribonucleoside hydrolase rihA [Serratia marcescens]CUY58892.1 Pyrimidine-specific ribonucleoside hydrolase rihA [Serratia marcescens]CUY77218.1 Pyrimidine-specific ribonucleoside hydrolase rihA [Serratia marcescens]